MQSVLIQNVQVLVPSSTFYKKVVDVHVLNGKISKIGKSLQATDNDRVLDADGQVLALGFFDLNANFGEPGFETKENIITGSQAALAGGFTGVAVQPNTQPPLHRHAEIMLVNQRAESAPIDIYPIGTVSKGRQGQELAEIYDMQLAGAKAFSDGEKSIQDTSLMSKALLYAKGIDALIISFPEDQALSDGAQMNEGVVSTYLGMKGKPNLSESMMVARDLYLAEYHDYKIHFTTISTKESVELIRQAKSKGIAVTADVAAYHLFSTDEDLMGFDSQLKTNPPLRTKLDQDALKAGLLDGTIDAIVSQHTPHEIEFKNVEFHIAKNGMIGLQTVLPLLIASGLTIELIIAKLSVKPREILDIAIPSFEEGSEADFVIFDATKTWNYTDQENFSKSSNSPYKEIPLKGKVMATFKGVSQHITAKN